MISILRLIVIYLKLKGDVIDVITDTFSTSIARHNKMV